MWVCGIDPGIRDLGTCLMRIDTDASPRHVVLDWRVTDMSKYKDNHALRETNSDNSMSVEDVVSGVVDFVKELVSRLPETANDVYFVIERQFINPRMISVSHAIQAALESWGYRNVHFVHSMNRFHVVGQYNLLDDVHATTGNVKTRSEYLAHKLLAHDPKRQEQLATAHYTKRDDMSDAFLFALSFGNEKLGYRVAQQTSGKIKPTTMSGKQ